MKAEKLDIKNQFRTILREVREKGECIVDTGSIIYVLKPEPLRELKKLTSLPESLDYSAVLPNHCEDCLSCSRERTPWLSRALRSFEEGRLDEARVLGTINTVETPGEPYEKARKELGIRQSRCYRILRKLENNRLIKSEYVTGRRGRTRRFTLIEIPGLDESRE